MSIQVPYTKTLGMYRRMLKSMMVVFKGDPEMFHRCRLEIRKSIKDQSEERDPAKVNELLFQYEETRRILMQNVV
jgi:complex III assembly factor LYRM7